MARASEEVARIEADRRALIAQEQRKLRARLQREVKVKKAGAHLPGEILLLKHMAVFLKVGVPGISYTDIANRLGEKKSTVKSWFRDDPVVKEFYDFVTTNLKDGALELMKTYSLEAVETLVILMRFGSEKYMFESAREILDRIGVPKVSRTELEHEHTEKYEWADHDRLVEEIRTLPPELQEEAIKGIENLQELLGASRSSEVEMEVDEENGELKPITGSEDDDEEEDDING